MYAVYCSTFFMFLHGCNGPLRLLYLYFIADNKDMEPDGSPALSAGRCPLLVVLNDSC